jgi:hypothetical protein
MDPLRLHMQTSSLAVFHLPAQKEQDLMTANLMELSDEALRGNTEMHFGKLQDDLTSLMR